MVYLFLADGFEETEAIVPLDILRRANVKVKTVGVSGKNVTGAHGITVTADILCSEINFDDISAVILPGGMPGTLNLQADKFVEKAILTANDGGKLIAAICAAPKILGNLGLLNGREAVCYDGFESELKGAVISENKVVQSGNIITAVGAGAAAEFGFKIVNYICSDTETAAGVRAAMKYS